MSQTGARIREARKGRIDQYIQTLSSEENRRYALAYSFNVIARTYRHPPLDGVTPRAAEIIRARVDQVIRGE